MAMPSVYAENYPFLTFETIEGGKISLPSESLTLSFDGNNLNVGGQTFLLSNLNKMYFTLSDESVSTSIQTHTNEIQNGTMEVFDLKGCKVPVSQMKKGEAYIVKDTNHTHKLIMK